MKRLFLTFLLFLVTSTTTFATTWVQISDNEYIDKDSIKYYINDNGTTNYYKKVFWLQNLTNDDNKNIKQITNKPVAFSVAQLVIDYQNNTTALKAGIMYDKEGQPISSFTLKDVELEWRSIVPSSKADYLSNLVKSPRTLKKMYKYQQEQIKE